MENKKNMEILYRVHNNLYVNLTNRCPCACRFCLRQTMDTVGESAPLWLDHEPDFDEVKEAFAEKDMDEYEEVVFCGFGEPTEAFEMLKKTADFVKETYRKPIRLNTNGLGNRINGRDIVPELEGRIDTISISLNTPNAEEYLDLVQPVYGIESYQEMLDFAEAAARVVPHVVMTTVGTMLTPEEEEQCAEICRSRGVTYRIRPYEE